MRRLYLRGVLLPGDGSVGAALTAHMLHDKKMDAGTLPFVLLRGVGEALPPIDELLVRTRHIKMFYVPFVKKRMLRAYEVFDFLDQFLSICVTYSASIG